MLSFFAALAELTEHQHRKHSWRGNEVDTDIRCLIAKHRHAINRHINGDAPCGCWSRLRRACASWKRKIACFESSAMF